MMQETISLAQATEVRGCSAEGYVGKNDATRSLMYGCIKSPKQFQFLFTEEFS